MRWSLSNKRKWRKKFVFFPRQTIDGYRVWFGFAYRRYLDDDLFFPACQWAVQLPSFRKEDYPDKSSAICTAACIICGEGDFPVCEPCRRTVQTFRTIADVELKSE